MKEYSFVDMHIHTEFSDEELCDMTIEQLLEKAQKKADITKTDCVIAIADHNTILGVQEARRILKEDGGKKYPNVKLINGIEFTTDLVEMQKYFDDTRVFTRCHTLAYGYRENDPELTAYSKITHMFFNSNDNIGMQICAARRRICEKYDIYIPFSVFENMTYLNKNNLFKYEFLSIVNSYLKQNKIEFNKKENDILVSPYISNQLTYNREASAMGRLKASEVGKLVKDAGGELVIAHPCLIRITVKGLPKLASRLGLKPGDIYVVKNRKYGNNTDLGFIKHQKEVLGYFVKIYEKICGMKVSGLEKYYASNYSSRLDKEIEELCKETGMYETCGSDYHGEHLHPDKNLGIVFNNGISSLYRNQFEGNSIDKIDLLASGISSVEHIKDNHQLDANKTIIKTSKGKLVQPADYEKVVDMFAKGVKATRENRVVANASKDMFLNRVSDLNQVVSRFDKILRNGSDPRKQAKLMLRLNLFAENIASGMEVVATMATNDQKVLASPEYSEIVALVETIKARYYALVKNNPRIVNDLKSDMKYYYKKRDLSIIDLAKIDLPKPVITPEATLSRNSREEVEKE